MINLSLEMADFAFSARSLALCRVRDFFKLSSAAGDSPVATDFEGIPFDFYKNGKD